jgi:Family of unknown function (DUF6275)
MSDENGQQEVSEAPQVRLIEPKPNLTDLVDRIMANKPDPSELGDDVDDQESGELGDEDDEELDLEEPVLNGRLDPDRFLILAKQLVIDNYNANHNPERTPPLEFDEVYIDSFTKSPGGWKACIASPIVKGLYWVVGFNSQRSEAYLDIYKKINKDKVKVRKSRD